MVHPAASHPPLHKLDVTIRLVPFRTGQQSPNHTSVFCSFDAVLRKFIIDSFNKNVRHIPTYFAKIANKQTNKQTNGTSPGDRPKCVVAPS
jgi:hypothetical protein